MDVVKWEVIGSFVIWTSAVCYSIYGVIKASAVFQTITDHYGDFKDGWLISTFKKDTADFEWESILKIFSQIYPWLFIHVLASEAIRRTYPKVLSHWQLLLSISCLIYNLGLLGALVVVIQPVIFHLWILKFKSTLSVWICGGLCLTLICYLKSLDIDEIQTHHLKLNDTQHYMLIMATCWTNLRCLSCYLDNVDNVKRNFIHMLCYCLYLPTLFIGPIILYSNFEKSRKLDTEDMIPLKIRLIGLLCSLVRFGFWFLFTEFALHFVYVNALSYQPELVDSVDNFTLYGYGYCMGQFFHLKYVFMYGISSSLSTFEHINAPQIPKCIGRIHLYSDMWKYFDEGLYKFLIKYIYLPTSFKRTAANKMWSSFLCFAFVYVWHGLQFHILIWTTLNFLGILIEILITNFLNSQYIAKNVNLEWKHRLFCVLASPLLAMSAISNFYFFAGVEIGNIFVRRFFQSTTIANSILLFFLYCCCNASIEIKQQEKSDRFYS